MGTELQEAQGRFTEAADRHLYCAEQLQAIARDLGEQPKGELVEQMARQGARQILIELANAEIRIAQQLIEAAGGQA